jgi:hypothetical protein
MYFQCSHFHAICPITFKRDVYATNQNGCKCLVCHTRHLLESFNIVNKSLKWMENLHLVTRAKITRLQLLAPKSLLLLLLRKGLHVLQWFIYHAKNFQEHDCARNKTLANNLRCYTQLRGAALWVAKPISWEFISQLDLFSSHPLGIVHYSSD